MIVLDTPALIFWTLDQEKLSASATAVITEADDIIISSISIWEIGIKAKNGRLILPLSLREYLEKLKSVSLLSIRPVDEHIWLKNIELDWKHRDPADRTIVATASLLGCRLVTSDKKILDFYADAIW